MAEQREVRRSDLIKPVLGGMFVAAAAVGAFLPLVVGPVALGVDARLSSLGVSLFQAAGALVGGFVAYVFARRPS